MAELRIRVTPRSSHLKVVWAEPSVKVWVNAAPADGQANEQVCRVLADALKVPFSTISIIRGHRSREKTVVIPSLSVEEIQQRLS